MLKVAIIDDEPFARSNMHSLLQTHDDDFDFVGEADGVVNGHQLVSSNRVDLVFLDIEMQDGNGFDFLDRCRSDKLTFHVVFMTAFNQFAIRAFQYNAVDYLLKPIDPDELKRVLVKVRQLQPDQSGANSRWTDLTRTHRNQDYSVLHIVTKGETHRVPVSNIVYLKADGSYTIFRLLDGRIIVASKNTAFFRDLLSPEIFQRIHKSYQVNLDHIRSFHSISQQLEMVDGTMLPVSRRQKDLLIQKMRGR